LLKNELNLNIRNMNMVIFAVPGMLLAVEFLTYVLYVLVSSAGYGKIKMQGDGLFDPRDTSPSISLRGRPLHLSMVFSPFLRNDNSRPR